MVDVIEGCHQRTLVSLLFTLILTLTAAAVNDYQHSEKILLSDVKVLTLHQGRMTNSRRSSPVPQLKCVGGSAQYKFTPKVVQCTNRGSDGYDIQWECKSDMDNAYRFGHVEVSCEGYDYPNDPFILKGSCGLEFTIELTEEGRQFKSYSYNYQYKSEGGPNGLFVFGLILVLMYVIYKLCLVPSVQPELPPQQPPPYGFRPEYMPGQDSAAPPPYSSTAYPGYNSGASYPKPGYSTEPSGGGFWTGAATGGLLGYFLGNRGNNPGYNSGWAAPRGGFYSSGGSTSFSGGAPSSSGTRTASGFGGTSRR
ncbi:store-operated calcium entry-associated regulatory factor-like [Physella acuta]|uniref:store-operated calcium entry-associated regulatory factor-like n=1 Tax=Physella acuta TaxID=109671 RepID=UPI0027DC9E7B|nr:store-operated calcium entry-associated regulatory factor-like [Physella acuta]XP_059160994.1 store-operated calcium entry-associated regulatory factor-like [Physella acuta]XP_059160995.1 store-operated calcium entry-associated regulatory factor-like [Physella acuta]